MCLGIIHLFLKKDGWIGQKADKEKKEASRTFVLSAIRIICLFKVFQ